MIRKGVLSWSVGKGCGRGGKLVGVEGGETSVKVI